MRASTPPHQLKSAASERLVEVVRSGGRFAGPAELLLFERVYLDAATVARSAARRHRVDQEEILAEALARLLTEIRDPSRALLIENLEQAVAARVRYCALNLARAQRAQRTEELERDSGLETRRLGESARRLPDENDTVDQAMAGIARDEVKKIVSEMASTLSDAEREAVEAYLLEGEHEAAAAAQGITLDAHRQRMRRALTALRASPHHRDLLEPFLVHAATGAAQLRFRSPAEANLYAAALLLEGDSRRARGRAFVVRALVAGPMRGRRATRRGD
jgi:DNA-directed RNA polymerase specialized sigma24 family protein